MYPFTITWATNELAEKHEDDSYGYVVELSDLQIIIHKHIYKYIREYEYKIKNKIAYLNKDITLNELIQIFYMMVNSNPHMDYIFLHVKYFNYVTKNWEDYIEDEIKLSDFFHNNFIKF